MEIYKLNSPMLDEQGCSDGQSGASDSDGGVLKITAMRQGVKNPDRVNVFINGKYELSLAVAQVVDYRLKIGKIISSEELGELKQASMYGKLYQRTLEWALIRPRSVKETKEYLMRKLKKLSSETLAYARRQGGRRAPFAPVVAQVPSETFLQLSQSVISRLVECGYVDDRRFAEWWVDNRFVKKGVSRKRLSMELRNKGVKNEIIEEVLSARSDEEEARKMMMRKRARYDDEKLMAYLCRQGFKYDLVQRIVKGED